MAASAEETAISLILIGHALIREKKKVKRKCWTKQWLMRRSKLGVSNALLQELRSENIEDYRRYMRVDPLIFDELHGMIVEQISKQDTHWRKCISSEARLSLTMRYLATGKPNVVCVYLNFMYINKHNYRNN
jgi:hypothetical protein